MTFKGHEVDEASRTQYATFVATVSAVVTTLAALTNIIKMPKLYVWSSVSK